MPLVLIFVVSLLACFTATWLVSKLFAGKRGTFQNAVLYYIYQIVGGLVLSAAVFAIPKSISVGDSLVGVVLVIVAISAAVWIPMRVYEIGLFRALGFVIVAAIGSALASLAVDGGAMLYQLRKEGFLVTSPAAQMDPAVSSENQENLGSQVIGLHAELQRIRAGLNEADPAAVARFNERVANYNDLRAQFELARHK
jgi:hypothetical protein